MINYNIVQIMLNGVFWMLLSFWEACSLAVLRSLQLKVYHLRHQFVRMAAIDKGLITLVIAHIFYQRSIIVEGCIVTNLQEVHHGGGNFWMIGRKKR